MKNQLFTILLILSFVIIQNDVKGQANQLPNNQTHKKITFNVSGNPYLPLWEHIPDGKPRVFEDPDNPGKYRYYLIGSHDQRVTSYCGPDIHVWSAPVEDLSKWRDEGPVITFQDPKDGMWDVMFAPDMNVLLRFPPEVEKGLVKRTPKMKRTIKEYYLYPHSRGPGREAMVAKSSRPDGPFEIINLDSDGRTLLPGSIIGFDPGVWIEYVDDPKDPDYNIGFRAYGYWGFQESNTAELDQFTMWSIRPGKQRIKHMLPASSTYGVIRDPEGTVYPYLFPDEDPKEYGFFEASALRKVGNKYIWVYSGHSGPDYGLGSTNSALRFAYADSPQGPWRSGGVLVDSRGPVLNEDGSSLVGMAWAHNTHGGIQLINDQWYAFYHRPPAGRMGTRQAMVAPIKIEWDEKPVSKGGKVKIRAYNPYSQNEIWTAKDNNGVEYTGAEVTSEGFNIYGLDPYKYYSAGYTCYLSNGNSIQDSWDIWDNHMSITNVANGDRIGFKYFGFGGLDKAKKGLKPFEGTKPGNNTKFNLYLTPKTFAPFKVNVWLDGPWDNDVWKGTKIGEIEVPVNSKQEITRFSIDVSKFVDHLDKKHAIFLVAEGGVMRGRGGPGGPGGGQSGLFDLIGLGFSSDSKDIERHVAPKVSIAVNDVGINMPEFPVRSTNANGVVGYGLYESIVSLSPGAVKIPTVTAYSNNPEVKINITQTDTPFGTAIVKFDYKGIIKTYRVIFTPDKI